MRGLVPCALVAWALVATPVAAAQEGLRLNVERGYEGSTRAYTPNPLTVTIEADRLFSGWIEVVAPNSNNAETRYRQRIEVPGGSRKSVHLLTPRSTIHAVLAVDDRGRTLAEASIPAERALRNGEHLVGMLTVDPPRVNAVDVPIVEEAATVVAVPAGVLDLGPHALSALSHLVVDGPLLGSLSPTQRRTIQTFAGHGGEVVIAAGSDDDLASMPPALRRGASVRSVPFGAGRITAAMTPLADAGWDAGGSMWRDALRPIDTQRWTNTQRNETLSQALRETGGFRRPTLGWLLAFVLAYVALVGPVNFMVLARMRRRELAWVTIPAASLLFAAGAYVAGMGLRDEPVLQGVGVRYIDGVSVQDEIALGAIARRGNQASLTLEGDWVAEVSAAVAATAQGQRLEVNRNAVTARFDLATGEVGTLVAERLASNARALLGGTAEVAGQDYKISLTNPLGVTLRSPHVFVGSAAVAIDPLEAGMDRTMTLSVHDTSGRDLLGFDEGFIHIGPGRFGGGDENDTPPSAMRRIAQMSGAGLPGTGVLAGWVPLDQLADELGMPGAEGNILVALRLDVRAPGPGTPAQTVRRTVVANDAEHEEFGFPGRSGEMLQGARNVVIRFELPDGATPRRLRISGDGPNRYGISHSFGARGRGRTGGVDVVPLPAPGQPEPFIDPEEPAAPGPAAVGTGLTGELFDFEAHAWVRVPVRPDGRIEVAAGGGRRFVSSEGQVYLRVRSQFPTQIAPSAFLLEGVTT